MDPTVPKGAAILLDFVRKIEVGSDGRESYDVIYGHNQRRLPKPLTSMSVDGVIAAGPGWTRAYKSSAAGGYQFMNATLKGLKTELRLRGSQIFDPNLQDRLAYHLLKRRGYEDFMASRITRTEFGRRLAMEWASFPVLAATRGAHRQLSRGQSYYTGDPLNKALVSPEALEAIIDRAKAAGNATQPRPQPSPSPPIEPASQASGVGTTIAVILIIAAIIAAVAILS